MSVHSAGVPPGRVRPPTGRPRVVVARGLILVVIVAALAGVR
jgi:hypothetical protein